MPTTRHLVACVLLAEIFKAPLAISVLRAGKGIELTGTLP